MARRTVDTADEGNKRATVKEVAARAGVSTATVSRVLGGTYPVAAGTRIRVQRALTELDYVVNANARALGNATSNTVAFIVNDVTGPFFAHIAQGVEQQATAEGRLCLVCTTHSAPDRELAVINLMREQRAEAVILVGGAVRTPQYTEHMIKLARSLDAEGSRLVLCGRPSLGPGIPETVVQYDNEGGAFAMSSYLLSLGHERIALLGVEPTTTATERVAGYRHALESRGLPFDPDLVIPGRYDRESGYEMTHELLAKGTEFTAVFAVTDMIAAGVLKALHKAKIRVPQDVSVVGYDDIPLATDLLPELTTVHVPHEELGRAAVRLALNRDTNPVQHLTMGTHVVVRDSAGPPGTWHPGATQ
ncbi:LacI family DNA-binding transcriptional regulator [Streptomyces phaeochromogenes]|uniref:LacI family DNA-binding transcriptional regulator n=1 Tax=Streptomyces phaeochromogenes TaxID=1923 RepID=UPI002DD80B4C|nr:LacI family DNA-binding transcriptional regulator [Streptomyces phaeochromogenes]WRZ34641.1 LacI family transcriptional regulator [Streptomyces phaeochromogenes]